MCTPAIMFVFAWTKFLGNKWLQVVEGMWNGGCSSPARSNFREEKRVQGKSAQSAEHFPQQRLRMNIFLTDVCILNEKFARFSPLTCCIYISSSVTRGFSTLWLTVPQLSFGLWAHMCSTTTAHKCATRPPFSTSNPVPASVPIPQNVTRYLQSHAIWFHSGK